MGFFGRKKKGIPLQFQSVSRTDADGYFNLLSRQGWTQIGTPFEFNKKWNIKKIRNAARDYATKQSSTLLVEVNDPMHSTSTDNNLIYHIFSKLDQVNNPPASPLLQPHSPNNLASQSHTPPNPTSCVGEALFLKSHYSNFEDALVDSLSNLAKMLCIVPTPFQFLDSGEFIGKFAIISRGAYAHVGGRSMDIILVNSENNRYQVFGNEAHDASSRRVQYRRDDIALLKTDGIPRFDLLPDYGMLDVTQKGAVATNLYSFLERYLPKK